MRFAVSLPIEPLQLPASRLPVCTTGRPPSAAGDGTFALHELVLGRCLKERLQKEDKGGHIILESIIFSLRYKAGPQGALLNPKGGARFAIGGR